METFSALLAICAGNSPVTGEFRAQRPVTRSFDVSFDVTLWKHSVVRAHDVALSDDMYTDCIRYINKYPRNF